MSHPLLPLKIVSPRMLFVPHALGVLPDLNRFAYDKGTKASGRLQVLAMHTLLREIVDDLTTAIARGRLHILPVAPGAT